MFAVIWSGVAHGSYAIQIIFSVVLFGVFEFVQPVLIFPFLNKHVLNGSQLIPELYDLWLICDFCSVSFERLVTTLCRCYILFILISVSSAPFNIMYNHFSCHLTCLYCEWLDSRCSNIYFLCCTMNTTLSLHKISYQYVIGMYPMHLLSIFAACRYIDVKMSKFLTCFIPAKLGLRITTSYFVVCPYF